MATNIADFKSELKQYVSKDSLEDFFPKMFHLFGEYFAFNPSHDLNKKHDDLHLHSGDFNSFISQKNRGLLRIEEERNWKQKIHNSILIFIDLLPDRFCEYCIISSQKSVFSNGLKSLQDINFNKYLATYPSIVEVDFLRQNFLSISKSDCKKILRGIGNYLFDAIPSTIDDRYLQHSLLLSTEIINDVFFVGNGKNNLKKMPLIALGCIYYLINHMDLKRKNRVFYQVIKHLSNELLKIRT